MNLNKMSKVNGTMLLTQLQDLSSLLVFLP